MKVLVYDDSVLDSHKERILVAGIDFSRFEKNPIILFEHDRFTLPVGRGKNWQVEGSKLYMDIEFDNTTEFDRIVKEKFEKGFLNAVSLGGYVVATDDSPQAKLSGQILPTITKLELGEVSIVKFPSHKDAVAQRHWEEIEQAWEKSFEVKKAESALPIVHRYWSNKRDHKDLVATNSNSKMKEITKYLGIAEDSTEAQVIAKIKERNASLAVVAAKTAGLIDEAGLEDFTAIANADPEAALRFAAKSKAMSPPAPATPAPPAEPMRSIVDALEQLANRQATTTTPDETTWEGKKAARTAWTLTDWSKKDPEGLRHAMEQDKEFYTKLKKGGK